MKDSGKILLALYMWGFFLVPPFLPLTGLLPQKEMQILTAGWFVSIIVIMLLLAAKDSTLAWWQGGDY